MTAPAFYCGVLSGTSMDAVDCVLMDFSAPAPRIVDFICAAFPSSLKSQLLALMSNENIDLRSLGNASIEVARLFASAVHTVLEKNGLHSSDLAAIGSHGQTIWHEPPQSASKYPFTLQIGDPNTIAELTGVTVVADFRGKDMAAGGQGAPIVPAMHREFFQSTETDRIVLNLGGIANITWLPRSGSSPIGMDTGPASVLMDTWIKLHKETDYDSGGAWARSGRANPQLLAVLLDEAYFGLPHPKSTGRELFNLGWLKQKLARLAAVPAPEDVQATLLELTAQTICDQILKLLSDGEVIVCGGGARNSALIESLQSKLGGVAVKTASDYGIDADSVEAIAFAWLAKKTMQREVVDFSPFTGARHPVIAGGIYFSEPKSQR